MTRLSLLALVVFSACQFAEGRYASREVPAAELTGKWYATAAGIEALREVGLKTHLAVADHRLVLNADGSCEAKTFTVADPHAPYVDVTTGCSWKLGHSGGHQELLLLLPTDFIRYSIAEENGRLYLWQYAGDPDAWRYMEFRR